MFKSLNSVLSTELSNERALQAMLPVGLIKPNTTTVKEVDRKIKRAAALVAEKQQQEIAAKQRELWLERCWQLYSEYISERKSVKLPKWRRQINSLDLSSIRSSNHEQLFNDLCNEGHKFFESLVLSRLDDLDERSSRSYVLKRVLKEVSQAQRDFSNSLNCCDNKECKAIYASALKKVRKQGYDKYCRNLAKEVHSVLSYL